ELKAVEQDRDSRIDKVALRKSLGERLIGHRLLYFLSLPSTNRHVRELAEDGWPEGTVVMAEEQTAGRGRTGRTWHSPPGVGLYFSFLLKPQMPIEKIPLLTLMTAVGVARGLRDCGYAAEIKWPNDLLLGGRKAAGILAETRLRPSSPPEVVVGVGVNVNQGEAHFPPDLRARAGSLKLATGRAADRTAVLSSILQELNAEYETFRATGEGALIDAVLGLCPMARGATVTVTLGRETISGQTSGLGPTGALRVATPSGVREVHAGEAHLGGGTDAPRG
ncbi:MAG TPA: biotin--[acetyl-CoA-carboxylase] ligase, partial [Candidatus Saccharimonadales bacterium]|nr:biotin--[acetyl-CoA-carboxylase] ligase [Candidatus Saccharimonadales bacterium]